MSLAWGGLALAWQAGLGLTWALDLPLPGSLTGMALLLLVLALRPSWAGPMEAAARPLLGILVMLFIPAGAKIVELAPQLAAAWLPLAGVVLLSTGLALAVTALTVKALAARIPRGPS